MRTCFDWLGLFCYGWAMRKNFLIFLLLIVFKALILVASSGSPDTLARSVQYRKGKCPPLADNCRCGLARKQGKACLFQVIIEADGNEVPGGKIYAATLECSGNCKNNDPPAPGEAAGAVILRGPKHPDVWPHLEPLYRELKTRISEFKIRFEGKPLTVDTSVQVVRAAEEKIIEAEKKIARLLLEKSVGYFYQSLPAEKRIPFENFVFHLDGHSPEGASMETNVQFGARLFIYTDCFIDAAGKPTPDVFCASILHEIYHWQQENYGAGLSDIENILYELACTEKMRLNSFYVWMLGAVRANREYFEPERNHWVERFNNAWNGLDRAARKKISGWAWSRGGVNDSTPEDPIMRLLMYSRQGWFFDIWETLFEATELKIIRPWWKPLYKKKESGSAFLFTVRGFSGGCGCWKNSF